MASRSRPGRPVAGGTPSPDGGNADARFLVQPPGGRLTSIEELEKELGSVDGKPS